MKCNKWFAMLDDSTFLNHFSDFGNPQKYQQIKRYNKDMGILCQFGDNAMQSIFSSGHAVKGGTLQYSILDPKLCQNPEIWKCEILQRITKEGREGRERFFREMVLIQNI